MVSRHEDHALWVESMLFSHLNPVGTFYAKYIRPINGHLFGIFGRSIYGGLVAWTKAYNKVRSLNIKYVTALKMLLEIRSI